MPSSPVAVGTTDGQNSTAIRFAIAEAVQLDRQLRIVHVHAGRERTAEEDIGHDLDDLPSAVTIECVTAFGDPTEALLNESEKAVCLVLPAGGVARQVAMHARRPVIVVPTALAVPATGARIVVGVDVKGPIGGQIAYAIEAAELRGVALEVVFAAGALSDYPERQQLLIQLEDIIDRWRLAHPRVQIHVSVEGGHAAQSCLAAGKHASLIVVGSPQSKHPRIGSWSVASKIVDRSTVPVAVVPNDYAPRTD